MPPIIGNVNPAPPDYDSLAGYIINEKEGIIELRIPGYY